jgi:hypothetical protein
MLHDWENLFGDEKALKEFVDGSTMIHFTCVEQSLKTYFGYYFGGFGNMDAYYSEPPPLLGTTNIAGMADAIHAQVVLAAQLAHKSHRTMIWPNTVDIMRKRWDDQEKQTVLHHEERQPGIRTISWDSARKIGIKAVEGNYLNNLKRIAHVQPPVMYFDVRMPLPTLLEEISKLPLNYVAMLDFKHFGPPIDVGIRRAKRQEPSEASPAEQEATEELPLDANAEAAAWLEEKEKEWFSNTFIPGGYKDWLGSLMESIRVCPRANMNNWCLENCG